MSGRWLLAGLLLAGTSVANAAGKEMTAEERARLQAEALKLNEAGVALYQQGKPFQALQRFEAALAMRRKLYPAEKFPDGHADLAQSLNNMGFVLESLGRLEGTLEHFQQALAMNRKLYPAEKLPDGHADLVQSLNHMGHVLHSLGRLEGALEHYQQTLAMCRKLYPAEKFPAGHADLANSLSWMGFVLQHLGRLEGALEHSQQALAMNRKLYPAEKFSDGHPALAASLNNMGLALESLGRLEGALEHKQQALAMNRKLYPAEKFPNGHADLATSLNNVGHVLQSLGRLEGALEHKQQALAMNRKLYPAEKFPDGHPALAAGLNNMGSLLESLGRLEGALEQFQQALAMCRKLYPAEKFPAGHAYLARSLNNMGFVLQHLGRLEGALEHYQQALAMNRKLYPAQKFPDGHADLANSLNNMGHVLQYLGRLEGALEHHQQALAMDRKLYPAEKFPAGHAHLALSLNSMGRVLEALGRLEGALEHDQLALTMCRKLYPAEKFPAGHAYLARSLDNMGGVLHSLGRLEGALEHYQQTLAMCRKLYPAEKFPDGHADLAKSLSSMGTVLHSLGRLEGALEHHQQALAMNRKLYPAEKFPDGHSNLAANLSNMGAVLQSLRRYEQSAPYLEQALAMSRRLTDTLVFAASEGEALALAHAQGSYLSGYLSATQHLKESAPSAYPHVWSERSALTRILAQRYQAARLAAAGSAEVRQRLLELQGKRRALAHLLQQPLPQARDALRERDRRVNELTQDKQRLERDLLRLLPDLDKQHQLSKLGPDDLRQDLPEHTAFVDLLHYGRWEFDPKKPGRDGTRWTPRYVAFVVCQDRPVERIEVGEAEPIETALKDWRHLIEQRKEHDSPQVAEKLRRLLWEPIGARLPPDTRTVLLASDAGLTRLPWAALPGSKPGTILLQDHALAVVPNGPFLLEQLRSPGRFGKGTGVPLVVGGIWKDLPGTERELRLLQALYGDKVVAVEGRAAGVSRVLKELPQARLVHLATHGFFNEQEFQREQQRAKDQARDLLRSQEILSGPLGFRISAGAKSPLAYTGLLLAGADQPEKAGTDGGILTGEAILGLDLRQLELAVLSACQTGLGDVADGECVFNLQHAFHLAGCQNVVASLWSVPDEPTAALMGLFYRELQAGKPPLQALRAAQLYLYQNPGQIKELAQQRLTIAKGGKLPEPKTVPQPMAERKYAAVKDWAGFVLSGLGR